MHRYELVGLLTLAAALRLLLLFLWTPELSGDAIDYDRLARSLVEGRGYTNTRGEPTSWRPPLYPAFVALGYFVGDGSRRVVRFLQIVLDLGTVALTYHLGRRFFGRAAGLVAGLLVAVNPSAVSATSRLLSESLFTFLLVAAVAASVSWLQAIRDCCARTAIAQGIGVGAILGLGTLTRAVLLFYPLYLVIFTALNHRTRPSPSAPGQPARQCGRAGWGGCVAVVIGFTLVLLPWTLRNQRVHGAFVPVATQSGMALYSAYNPPSGWKFGLDPDDHVTAAAAQLPEVEASAVLTRAALNSITSSPRRALRLEILKVVYFWVPIDWEILPLYGAFNLTYAFIGLWAFAYTGLRSRLLGTPPTWLVWLPILYLFGMALAIQASPRYRLPVEPFLALFAASALTTLYHRTGRTVSLAVAGSTVAVSLLAGIFSGPIRDLARTWIAVGW